MFNDDFFDKYTLSTLKNLNSENSKLIIAFLIEQGCNFIEELLSDYLDLFTIDYPIFVQKYYILNKKYHNHFLDYVANDMNLLEEFYN